MASFEKTVTRKVRTEYRVHAPAHASEVYKALDVAQTDVRMHVDRFPLAPQPEIFVTSNDEHVVVYWEHEQAMTSTRGDGIPIASGSMVPGR